MKKQILVLFILFAIVVPKQIVFAQSTNFIWAKGMGGAITDLGQSITTDLSGNVYTTGIFRGTVDFDPGMGIYNLVQTSNGYGAFISKLDNQGNFIWAKSVDVNSVYGGLTIKTDAIGNIYIGGCFDGTVDFDPSTNNYILTGNGSGDFFILKLDPTGNFLWAKSIGGTYVERCTSLAIDTLGYVFCTGNTESSSVDYDPGLGDYTLSGNGAFVLKLDSMGNFIWVKKFNGYASGYSITLDINGNIYTTGQFGYTVDFDPGPAAFNITASFSQLNDIFISKIDSSGNFLWAKGIGGNTQFDKGNSIAVDIAGNSYSTGKYDSGSAVDSVDFDPGLGVFKLPSSGGYLLKLNSSGDFVWAKKVGDIGSSISIDNSANTYTGGYGNGFVISKTDSSGNPIWKKAASNTECLGITLDNMNNILFTGKFNGVANFDPGVSNFSLTGNGNLNDIFVSKFGQTSTGVYELYDALQTKIFPNPTSGILNFISYQNLNKATIKVYNAFGQLVFQNENTNVNSFQLNLNQQANGVYSVIFSIDREIYSTKIIVQR